MAFHGDSIYWVEVEKVVPNPFQPRREFDEHKLQELAESIRMYGVLQPLTVTRQEVQNSDGTFYSQYELIAGERRLRASRLAGVAQVPVIIREGEQSEQEKLELAIIENLQREDLNAIDRALAFQQLADQFKLSHSQVAAKVGRSREYVANSIRLLNLPEEMQASVQRGELGEGHARTLLMLSDRPEEQQTLFREVLLKKMSVRELERISRKIATDKVRKPHLSDIDQHLIEIEKEFTETLGTRVQIQKTEFGGKLTIDYFSDDDLSALLERVKAERAQQTNVGMGAGAAAAEAATAAPAEPHHPVTHMPATAEAHAHTTQSVPDITPEPNPEPPATDPSLLQRLAAHTPLSFGGEREVAAPMTESEIAPPASNPVTTEPDAPAPPESQPLTPQNPTNHTPSVDLPEAPTQPPEDDQQLYSLRNFTV